MTNCHESLRYDTESPLPKPAYKKEDDTDSNICKKYTHPDLIGERVHEWKDTSFLNCRLLDHNTDPQAHVRFRKVHNPLALWRNRYWCNSQVNLLKTKIDSILTYFYGQYNYALSRRK
jgi:hypothetical protein